MVTNPPGYVPEYGQGLQAKKSQSGAVGTKDWLRSIKLHKYWPLVSHWSYSQMISLTEENIDSKIKMVGGTDVTKGAKGKLLKYIEELRRRTNKLSTLLYELRTDKMNMFETISSFKEIVKSPLPTSKDQLPILIVAFFLNLKKILLTFRKTNHYNHNFKILESDIKSNPVLKNVYERIEECIVPKITITGVLGSKFHELSTKECKLFKDPKSAWSPIRNPVMLDLIPETSNHKLLLTSPFCNTYPRTKQSFLQVPVDLAKRTENLIIDIFEKLEI